MSLTLNIAWQHKNKLVIFSLLGITLLGDAMLYVVLPAQASALALTAGQIGILLSINRIIRLGSNFWATVVYEKFGRNLPFYFAVVIGSAVTLGYSLSHSFWYLLLLRLIWGLSYSLLRLRALLTIFSSRARPDIQGRLSGIYRSISRIGYMTGMIAGGVLADLFSFSGAALILGAISFFSVIILLVFYILCFQEKDLGPGPLKPELKTSANFLNLFTDKAFFLLLLAGIIVHFTTRGLINSSYGLFLQQSFGYEIALPVVGVTIGVASLNGFILSSNSVIELIFSPLLGWIVDKFKKKQLIFWGLLGQSLLIISLILMDSLVVAMVAPLFIFLLTAFLIILLYIKVNNIALQTTSRRMAALTTAGDLGAALGPLTLFFVDLGSSLSSIYLVYGLIIALMAFYQRKQLKPVKSGGNK